MKKARHTNPTVPASFFAKLALPFVVPAILTLLLAITVNDHWPRTIASGSGLKFAGFLATAVTALLVWKLVTRAVGDGRIRSFAALVCAATGLMGWPVWSVGVLPSVNGSMLEQDRTVHMVLERTETTHISRSRELNHWAWLKAEGRDSPISSGRYYISEQTYSDWSTRTPGPVSVTVARGLLGAEVVVAYN